MKRAYYAAQEPAYRKIKENGEAGWLVKSFDEFRDPSTETIIKNYVRKYFKDTSGLSALDLGTGTGPTAHMLHDLGFDVLGIDVCPSAIEYARELALKEKKQIRFEVSDSLFLDEKFDLIYDSHCSHCIVLEEDRERFFNSVYESLNDDGYFLLDSMVFDPSDDSWKRHGNLRFDANFILWHPTKDESQTGVVKIDDILWCPQRRIYPVEKILQEIQESRLKIVDYQIDESMLRALCTR